MNIGGTDVNQFSLSLCVFMTDHSRVTCRKLHYCVLIKLQPLPIKVDISSISSIDKVV